LTKNSSKLTTLKWEDEGKSRKKNLQDRSERFSNETITSFMRNQTMRTWNDERGISISNILLFR